MMFHRSVRPVLAARAIQWFVAIVIVVGILPYTVPSATDDAAEFAVERDIHIAGSPVAGSAQMIADVPLTTTSAALLGQQLQLDAHTVSGRYVQRRPRVRVLRIQPLNGSATHRIGSGCWCAHSDCRMVA